VPYSKSEGKKEILSYLKYRFGLGENLTVLDVGAGSGTYGKLIRKGMPKSRILGVEIFEPYIDRFGLKEIYDRVIAGNVLEDNFDLSSDVVIFGDVLEHMDHSDALSVLKKFFLNSAVCVVSIPIITFPQGESDGNVYETHLNQWNFSTFKDDMVECDIPVRLCLKGRVAGVFILSDELPPKIQQLYWFIRQMVHSYGAFAKRVRKAWKVKISP
jgi:hypothetical protein